MKILNTSQIRQADEYTIKHEPIPSIDLMERASEAFTGCFLRYFSKDQPVLLICGVGNNGGDGLAVARMLNDRGFSVTISVMGNLERASKDFNLNYDRVKSLGIEMIEFSNQVIAGKDVIVDALFGSGLTRPVTDGEYAEAIRIINGSSAKVISIDIPSGLFAEQVVEDGEVVEADMVVSFQVPKLAFFMPENERFIKEWEVVNIGLNDSFIDQIESPYYTFKMENAKKLLKRRPRFYHKGDAGRALLVGGSKGKIGASVLSARACLRAGVGLLNVHIPALGNDIVQSSVPEAMVILDPETEMISVVPPIDNYKAIGIGPGIGIQQKTYKALSRLLESAHIPLVLDADALNIISEHRELISLIPINSILTPHPGEFRRLVGDWTNDYERLELQKGFSRDHEVIIVLKNAHSSISLPDGRVFFNTTGNPGMATAGSGDVLTGIITGVLAQGYAEDEAALLSVFLHGLSGDLCVEVSSEEPLIASDIIENLSVAYKRLHDS